jgi:hypothetical protein
MSAACHAISPVSKDVNGVYAGGTCATCRLAWRAADLQDRTGTVQDGSGALKFNDMELLDASILLKKVAEQSLRLFLGQKLYFMYVHSSVVSVVWCQSASVDVGRRQSALIEANALLVTLEQQLAC